MNALVFKHLGHFSVSLLLTASQAEDTAHLIERLSNDVANSISCLCCTQAHSSPVPTEKLPTSAHPSVLTQMFSQGQCGCK